MLTPTSKVFLPVAGVALVLGAIYKILTKDVLGGSLFLMVGVVAFLLGVLLSTVRENEYAPVLAADAPPADVRAVAVAPLPGGGGWSLLAAIALGLVVLGLILHPLFTVAGVVVGLAAGAGWLARASSESTGRQISLMPVGMPVLGLVTIGSVMFFLSRILLTVPRDASTVIALVVAVLILGIATLLALRPAISSRTMVAALVIGSLLMVGGGIAAAARGERAVEKHGSAASTEGAGAPVQVKAQGIAFAEQEITVKADSDIQLKFVNDDKGTAHNISIAGTDPGKPIFTGDLVTGVATVIYKFHAPGPGTYVFQCDVHPAQMKGRLTVT